MNKLMIAILAVCTLGTTATAEDAVPQTASAKMMRGPDGKMYPVRKMTHEQMASAKYKATGGLLEVQGSRRGRVVYVNCQKAANVTWFQECIAYLTKKLNIRIDVEDGAFDLQNPALRGDVTIFVVDDPTLPMSLFAPEAYWGMANVAKLKSDQPQFFKARVTKELTRAFCHACGAANSQYPQALTLPVAKAEDLDKFMDAELPVDILGRMGTYLTAHGVTPLRTVTYRKACQEGWAPSPTNDVQKRIWDKIHELPSNPIKIKYDPKRDK